MLEGMYAKPRSLDMLIAQFRKARHDTGAIPFSYPEAIFIIGDIPYPVKPILDLPVPPV
jgi:hypothetical protein